MFGVGLQGGADQLGMWPGWVRESVLKGDDEIAGLLCGQRGCIEQDGAVRVVGQQRFALCGRIPHQVVDFHGLTNAQAGTLLEGTELPGEQGTGAGVRIYEQDKALNEDAPAQIEPSAKTIEDRQVFRIKTEPD